MKNNGRKSSDDMWKEWLLVRRFAGDKALMERALNEFLFPVRDKILDQADLQGSETLLDVGCGDGLVAFGALERLPQGEVIFSDISQDLLDHVQQLTAEAGISQRCRFIKAAAADLSAIADASVDVVTTRSVLIYEVNKARAFEEFFRVLRPGGRISLFEPINAFAYPPPRHIFVGFDVTPIVDITDKLKTVFTRLQPPGADPMLDFDERDLVEMAEAAGFEAIHLSLKIEIAPFPIDRTWHQFLNIAGNPKVPTIAEVVDEHLTAAERDKFEAFLRPLVESGEGKTRSALAYMWATK